MSVVTVGRELDSFRQQFIDATLTEQALQVQQHTEHNVGQRQIQDCLEERVLVE